MLKGFTNNESLEKIYLDMRYTLIDNEIIPSVIKFLETRAKTYKEIDLTLEDNAFSFKELESI